MYQSLIRHYKISIVEVLELTPDQQLFMLQSIPVSPPKFGSMEEYLAWKAEQEG